MSTGQERSVHYTPGNSNANLAKGHFHLNQVAEFLNLYELQLNNSTLVPTARLYAWRDKADPFSGGSVHAKVAVADIGMCFISSANLTGYAMEKNMEAGVLISGGQISKLQEGHLTSLVATNLISKV